MNGDEAMRATRELIEAADRVRQAFGISEDFPDGRIFGRPVMENLVRDSEPTCVTPELLDRITALESKVSWIQESAGEAQNEIERRVAGLEGHVVKLAMDLSEATDRLDTYGVPVVGRPKDVSPIEFLKRARGIEKQTLNTAEDRVRRYMAGHWSHASVEGVVAALRGGVEPLKQNSTA
jgi:hypothetical protein